MTTREIEKILDIYECLMIENVENEQEMDRYEVSDEILKRFNKTCQKR